MIFNDLIFFNSRTLSVRSSILNKITISNNKVPEEIDAAVPTRLGMAYLVSLFVCVTKSNKLILN
jgi:hypothetical protein